MTKRAIVVGSRRAAPTTPVPSWKVFNNQLYDGMNKPPPSARKLAASLWELQDLPLPACFSACLSVNSHRRQDSPKANSLDYSASSPHSQTDNGSSTPKMGRKTGSSRHAHEAHLRKLLSKSNMESGGMVDRQRHVPCGLFPSTRKTELGATSMSQELLKVFSQIRLLEEQHNASVNWTTALHSELMLSQARVRELELPHRHARREVEGLVKKFSEDKMAWKAKENQKIKLAVQSVTAQLEDERAVRHRLEAANRHLTKELIEAQSAGAKALQELEKERKARQLIEEVCHELAQETGEDKAEVEEMKREAQKVRDELEEERRMLQLAEVWREERVQMKLGEAKLALEEKTAALDVMKGELETFLRTQQEGTSSSHNPSLRDAQVLHNVISAISSEYAHGTPAEDTAGETLHYPEGIPDAD